MNHPEYLPGDNDCISMVEKNRACHPGGEPMILMRKSQAMALLMKKSPKPRQEPQKPEITRQQLILQLLHGLIPMTVGLTWVLGALEGLADPAFTAIVAGACGLWGCVEWKWGKVNG